MRYKLKAIALSLIVCLLFFITPNFSFASSNFATDYSVIYKVLDNSQTNVNFDITLINKTSQFFASSYAIQMGFKDIKNLKASDSDGPITPSITKNDRGQEIEIVFNKRVVGIDNKLNFNISFSTEDIAEKLGDNWEINIPGIDAKNDFQSFIVYVEVPSYLGNPAYLKPNVATITGNKFSFTKEQLGNSGISIAYGDRRFYDFNLTYHLQNKNLFPIRTEIALPPSTNYQEVQVDSVDPKPLNVTRDSDGNWLAQYQLSPSEKVNVMVLGKAMIELNPKREIVSSENLKEYLLEQPYWETSNEKIKNLATTLRTPHAIYEYAVKNLTYDFSRVTEKKGRLGAVKALDNKNSAVCLEFTDLFVAIARAAGIPAREINGFAYTQNDKERPLSLVNDVLHAWPEYYDESKQAWIMVDPTWGNTTSGVDYFNTLDLDHFAFVIKGKSSKYPIPAGGYKLEEEKESKDVYVSFTEEFPSLSPMLKLIPSFAKSYTSGILIKGEIIIENVGKNIADPKSILISTNYIDPTYQKISLNNIPPYGKISIPVVFNKTSLLTNITDTATITLAQNSIRETIKVSPFFFNKIFIIIGGIISVCIIIILSIIAFKPRNIPFSK